MLSSLRNTRLSLDPLHLLLLGVLGKQHVASSTRPTHHPRRIAAHHGRHVVCAKRSLTRTRRPREITLWSGERVLPRHSRGIERSLLLLLLLLTLGSTHRGVGKVTGSKVRLLQD